MASTMICWGSLSMEGSHQTQIISSWATTSIEVDNQLKLLCFYCATRSSTLRTSSCSEVTTSVPKSIESMASMMNVREDTLSNYGEYSVMCSIACQCQRWSTRKYSVCMEVSVLSSRTWIRLKGLWDQQMCQTRVSCVIYYGQIRREASMSTEIMIEEWVSLLVRMWSASSTRSMT